MLIEYMETLREKGVLLCPNAMEKQSASVIKGFTLVSDTVTMKPVDHQEFQAMYVGATQAI